MKKYISLLFIAIGLSGYAQVGVNTKNPQQKFHIDGKSSAATTNPTTGAPTAPQQVDDVVITKDGNVGTGITTPTRRLDINNGSTNGAIKIVDGTQGAGKLLMSNADGVGQWVLPNALKSVIVGTFTPGVQTSDGGGWKYSNVSIKLTKGVWMVNLGLTIKSFIRNNDGQWVHLRISSSNTGVDYVGWKNLGTANNNTSYAGTLFGSAVYDSSNNFQFFEANSNNYINGSNIIEVTDPEVTLYLMIENFPNRTVPAGTPNNGAVWQFDTGNWENYFYANPL